MYDYAIINGTIVKSDYTYKGNIYIENGKIAALTDTEVLLDAKEVVDAAGKYVFPGGIDTHMHIGEYVADFEEMDTSTKAAIVGGMTCLIDMPLNLKTPSVLNGQILEEKKAHLLEKSYADFCLYGAFTPDSISAFEDMTKHGAIGFKSFLSGAGTDFHAPNMSKVRDAMLEAKKLDQIIAFHCEDYWIIKEEQAKMENCDNPTRQSFLDSRPLIAEIIATRNIIDLAKETGAKVHICHVSHPDVAELVKQAQLEGVSVTAETCTHYLAFTEDDLLEKGCLYKCAPPLRDKNAREGLWKYIEDGTFLSVASDHSPGMPEDRDDTNRPIYEVGNGISGVQTGFQVYYDLLTKRGLCPSFIARTLSEQPAKRFGIYGKKGTIEVGFDADLVLLDPDVDWEISADELYYKQKISAFVGLKGKGKIVSTFLRGNLVAKNGNIVGDHKGEFVKKYE